MADQEPEGTSVVPATGRGALRASDADREQIVAVLQAATGDGRLTPEELDERLGLALTARTYDELATLITDLPTARAAGLGGTPPPAPKDLIRIHCSSGSAERHGRWVVPARMELKATSGSIKLDFTEAIIGGSGLHVDAEVRSGSITFITKPGIVVDMDDVSVRSGSVKVRAPWSPDTPAILRITVAGRCGSGSITARPPRRSFWQWLRRAPRPYAIAA
jgi:hypothetical protein